MRAKALFAGLAVLLPTVATASVIRQRPFAYGFDAAKAAESDQFVVCSGSHDDRITMLPAPPQLAVRLSRSEVRNDQSQELPLQKDESSKVCVNCLMGAVRFQFDSAVLTEKEKANLDGLLAGIPDGAVLNLDGFTCDLGSDAHNLDLSLRRANGVAAYLRGKNFSVGNVTGKGKCCPVSDDRHLNRRVEITTQKKEDK